MSPPIDIAALRALAVGAKDRAAEMQERLQIDLDADHPCEHCNKLVHGGFAILRNARGHGVLRIFSGYAEEQRAEFHAAAGGEICKLADALLVALDALAVAGNGQTAGEAGAQ